MRVRVARSDFTHLARMLAALILGGRQLEIEEITIKTMDGYDDIQVELVEGK